jgi:hypothetical protein
MSFRGWVPATIIVVICLAVVLVLALVFGSVGWWTWLGIALALVAAIIRGLAYSWASSQKNDFPSYKDLDKPHHDERL